MIIICGDFHGRFSEVNVLMSKKPEVSMILQCGDFGFWPKFHNLNKKSNYYDMYALKNKNIKIYWCDGNHEDHEELKKLTPENNYQFMNNVFYMKRGSVLKLPEPDGRKVLFIGGAYSIDKEYRTPGRDWFPEEQISQKDIWNLPDEKIDIVISHTAPMDFKVDDRHLEFKHDPSRDALNVVLNKYKPKLWYFGHMHLFKQGEHNGCKWTCLTGVGLGERWWIPLDTNIITEKDKKRIQQALSKCERFDDKKFMAYLRPDEILSLIKDGAKTDDEWIIKHTSELRSKGNCSRIWFYFIPGNTKPDYNDERGFDL